MTQYGKPLPNPTGDTKPFWDYCKKHELRMQKCTQCGYIRYPPSIVCPKCHSMETEWVRLSGKGKVFGITLVKTRYRQVSHQVLLECGDYGQSRVQKRELPLGNLTGVPP